MTKISVKLGGRIFAVGANTWDNWYAYIGTKKVDQFFGSPSEQHLEALAWLRANVVAYGNGLVCDRCFSPKPAGQSCDCFDNGCQ